MERFTIDAIQHAHGPDIIPAQLPAGGEIQELQLAKPGLPFKDVVSADWNDVHVGAEGLPERTRSLQFLPIRVAVVPGGTSQDRGPAERHH